MNAEDVIAVLRRYRYRFTCERDLQVGIASALDAAGIAFIREYRLEDDKGIIDFWIEQGQVGIECKIKGTLPDVTRQLFRYSESNQVDALILVTAKAKLGRNQPDEMNGVPLRVLDLWKTFL